MNVAFFAASRAALRKAGLEVLVREFMLAFTSDIGENILAGLPVVSSVMSGRFITAVFDGNAERIKDRLLALSPAVIEQLPINFEEVFITEVERRYDI